MAKRVYQWAEAPHCLLRITGITRHLDSEQVGLDVQQDPQKSTRLRSRQHGEKEVRRCGRSPRRKGQ